MKKFEEYYGYEMPKFMNDDVKQFRWREALFTLSDTSRVLKEINPNLEIFGVLLTMFDGRTNFSTQVAQEVRRHFPGKVFATVVPRNIRLAEAPSFGRPINYYDKYCKGARAYTELAKEILSKQ